MRKIPLIIAFVSASLHAICQQSNWPDLADVKMILVEDDGSGYDMEVPVFGPKAAALEGKEVVLIGYMIPLQEMMGQNYFVISSLPYNMCFFCGSAGPETVAEVNTKKQIKYTSNRIKISGVLSLNEDDPEHLMYIINEAELID